MQQTSSEISDQRCPRLMVWRLAGAVILSEILMLLHSLSPRAANSANGFGATRGRAGLRKGLRKRHVPNSIATTRRRMVAALNTRVVPCAAETRMYHGKTNGSQHYRGKGMFKLADRV